MGTAGNGRIDEYDLVVIGGGPVGENVAQYATSGSDRTVLVVEAQLLGGECSYWACMPSKALLRPLEIRDLAQHVGGVGALGEVDVDGVLSRRDRWVSHRSDAGQMSWATDAGLDVVRGSGRLSGERSVDIRLADGGTRTVHARLAVVLATGSVPRIPDALASVAPWTSRDATALTEVPSSIVIVGGGVVACEAATWLAGLGSRVTVLQRGPTLLPRFEPFVGDLVADGLRAAGVSVRTGASVESATRESPDPGAEVGTRHGGPVTVTLDDGTTVTADEVLAATGRIAATEDVGLESVGLDPGSRLRDVALPEWLYVVGDVSGDAQLTHWGKYRARVVGERIARVADGAVPRPVPDDVPVPQVVFTNPQVASVGMTERDARDGGVDVAVLDQPLSAVAGAALERDDLSGHARLVVDRASECVVGATFVGPDVADLVHAATVAIVGRVPLGTLRHAVASYPTASEIWLRLIESWYGY